MARKATIRYALFALGCIVLFLGTLNTMTRYDDGDFSKTLGEIARGNSDSISLQAITNFKWDDVYFFAPYEPRSNVCNTLHVQVKYCNRVIPFESIDDGEMSIAFLQEGRLVRYVRHHRYNGDFIPLPTNQPLSASQAKFRILTTEKHISDGKPWVKLVLDK